MEQPHREALDLQRLAAAAITGDPAGAGEHFAGGVDRGLVDPPENRAKLGQRHAEQIGASHLAHDNAAIRSLLRR